MLDLVLSGELTVGIRMSVLDSLKLKATQLRQHALTVYFVSRDVRTPLAVRALAVFVAAYAFSPIDLIPDFIPILGYLDDLLLIPLGLMLVIKLAPREVLESARQRAQLAVLKPVSRTAAVLIVLLWVLALWLVWRLVAKDGA